MLVNSFPVSFLFPFSKGFSNEVSLSSYLLTLLCGSYLFRCLQLYYKEPNKWILRKFVITIGLKSSWDFCSPRNILTLLMALTFWFILVHISLICISHFSFLSILTPRSFTLVHWYLGISRWYSFVLETWIEIYHGSHTSHLLETIWVTSVDHFLV